ncbi:hypothetical protein A3F02_00600 [Candidatus Curtissbacteria bacterium RIFCSPHIGHO2_12_FULL_38_9b]|uniref:Uncharacterized protein n=2 Tax=Candidatus Curtissiibacteriota TaxID=1752717 RepID=A0A1F5GW22_9BACT|nr:MAG: hypothetical protein A3A48_00595 [Candidatus Curtissbacteria bacterium RIFCSPLOWO2_01_FULL_37_9]OGD96093.1 MAG: hypothetical protein A3F02_00600 [Candidatus Curtissbacteria bacterium RIFCSPHIGHO2_12_FULL_38_9b]
MLKIEIIWRELLYQTIEKRSLIANNAIRYFTQKDIASKFGFSTSTVFQALKVPRKMGAVRVSGRNFTLEDAEKLLYHWASFRNLQKDVMLSAFVNLPVLEIEARMPPEIVFGGFSAAKEILGENVPADYDKVYVYAEKINEIRKRFEIGKGPSVLQARQGRANLTVLKADKFLASYGQITTVAQTFVDLWNLPYWYAKEYTRNLKEKLNGLLS